MSDIMSLSLRRAWIEMPCRRYRARRKRSLSLRRAWIEMNFAVRPRGSRRVALLTESVD